MYFQKELFLRFFLQRSVLSQLFKNAEKIFWIRWTVLVFTIFIIYSLTIQVAPYLHMDEVLTVELGRTFLHPDTDWSIAWMGNLNEPALVISYIGPMLQELVFHFFGQYSTRIFALACAMIAATVLVNYLLHNKISKNKAFLLGLVFLLDPLFVQAYTLGRIDGLTIALSLGACCYLKRASKPKLDYKNVKVNVLLSGALVTIAVFTWPSAIFLFPLVLMEMVNLLEKNKHLQFTERPSNLRYVGMFILAVVTTSLLIILPVFPQFYKSLGNIIEGLKINATTGPQFNKQLGFLNYFSPLIEFLRVLKFTPFLFLLAIIGLISKPNFKLLFALILAVVLIFSTIVYIHRVLYLLPYFILLIAFYIQQKSVVQFKIFQIPLKSILLSFVIIWCIGLSVVAKTYLGWKELINGRREMLQHAASEMIESVNERVLLLDTYELYYYGRSMGWKMFSPYASMGQPLDLMDLKKMLQHVNVVIIRQWQLSNEMVNKLMAEGFKNKSGFHLYPAFSNTQPKTISNEHRIRSLYRIVKEPYGPYYTFRR